MTTMTPANFNLGEIDAGLLAKYRDRADWDNQVGQFIPFRSFGHDRTGLVVGNVTTGDPVVAYRFPTIGHIELLRRLDVQAATAGRDEVLTRRLTTTELGTATLYGLGLVVAADLLVRVELDLAGNLARAEYRHDTLLELWEALNSVEVDGTTYAQATKRALYGRLFLRGSGASDFARADDEELVEVRLATDEELNAVDRAGSIGLITRGSNGVSSITKSDGGIRSRKIGKSLEKVRKVLHQRVSQGAGYTRRASILRQG